jgi:hypothetical protein
MTENKKKWYSKSLREWMIFVLPTIMVILIIGVVIAMPFLCNDLFTTCYKHFNFEKNGQIGDIIGGTTAPILSIISSVLVYLAFKEQLKANNEFKKELERQKRVQYLNDSINTIRQDIMEFEYYQEKDTLTYKSGRYTGVEAIRAYIHILSKSHNEWYYKYLKNSQEQPEYIHSISKFDEFAMLFLMFENLLKQIENESMIDKIDKQSLGNSLKYLYNSKMKPQFEVSMMEYVKLNFKKHPEPMPKFGIDLKSDLFIHGAIVLAIEDIEKLISKYE